MSGTSLLFVVLLVFVVLPAMVTLLVPTRWFPVWLGLFALFEVWVWGDPFDGPGAVFAHLGVMIISALNGIIVLARLLKIAVDRDREQ